MFNAYEPGFQRYMETLRGEINAALNRNAGGLRKYTDQQIEQLLGRMDELRRVTSAMAASRSGGNGAIDWGPRKIEDIPGRRVPYVMAASIPIGPDELSVREQSVTISQEGPFVAVRRMATFQSALRVQVTDPQSQIVSEFPGRSFGRFRPIHSVCDIMDSQHNAVADTSLWWLGQFQNPGAALAAELPGAVLGLPSSMSSFRSMEFDGQIAVINAGSSYPRQNIDIPSAFWSEQLNAPVTLGALDFFERGEVITVKVTPTHVNNPPAGNANADGVFPVRTAPAAGGWPFLDGQYDAHEGIATPDPASIGQVGPPLQPALLTTDPVERLPQGILWVAWEGYRIIQPVGPAG